MKRVLAAALFFITSTAAAAAPQCPSRLLGGEEIQGLAARAATAVTYDLTTNAVLHSFMTALHREARQTFNSPIRRGGFYEMQKFEAEMARLDSGSLPACFPALVSILDRAAERQVAHWRKVKQQLIDDAKPGNRLMDAYLNYVVVSRCNEVRRGYTYVFVNDVELQRAKEAVADIERSALKAEPEINADRKWAEANRLRLDSFDRLRCQYALSKLMRLAPRKPTPPRDFNR